MANGGDNAAVEKLSPKPEHMQSFLPLWNQRNAHIEARDRAREKLTMLTQEEGVSKDRLKELEDVAVAHEAEIVRCTQAMREFQA